MLQYNQEDADQGSEKYNSYVVSLADEFYINANHDLPNAERYENYDQYENGVGMMRYFLDEFYGQSKSFPKDLKRSWKVGIVTGTLAYGYMQKEILPKLNSIKGLEASLIVVPNSFYGNSVKVTGLLTGVDIYNKLARNLKNDLTLLPANCLNHDGIFLDDWSVEKLEKKLDQKINVISNFGELFQELG